MPDLSVKYLGLDLKSPVIAGSSGLTHSIEHLKAIEKAGAGAVVLKSVFEEEIYLEYAHEFDKLGPMDNNLEFLDYYDLEIKKEHLKQYLQLITEAKAQLSIPVIASINCVTSQEWGFFAKKIETAGADALELNLFISPTDLSQTSQDNESTYFDIITRVSQKISIPVSVKISPYFSNLGGMIRDISFSGVKGIVLFNRFYSPDIDINKETIHGANVLSRESDYLLPLRWAAVMSNRINCDLASSTGVHNWETAVKMILAGCHAVQVASALYEKGFGFIEEINSKLAAWMTEHNYETIDNFRGKLSQDNSINPAEFERVQFMKNFGEYKSGQ
ncbi:MAG TPA: dihydroorotate dehydrogenase-like protein [Prolixibacteraceae bacterium]|nr:dihydroorotate dehydrogenase-like protein [Prolixibacteraceae bacterium]